MDQVWGILPFVKRKRCNDADGANRAGDKAGTQSASDDRALTVPKKPRAKRSRRDANETWKQVQGRLKVKQGRSAVNCSKCSLRCARYACRTCDRVSNNDDLVYCTQCLDNHECPGSPCSDENQGQLAVEHTNGDFPLLADDFVQRMHRDDQADYRDYLAMWQEARDKQDRLKQQLIEHMEQLKQAY